VRRAGGGFRELLAAFYGDEATNMPRDAVTKGWRSTARMKKDSELEPLRTREDFRQLLAELEGKAKP
jgi:hypothetical protein